MIKKFLPITSGLLAIIGLSSCDLIRGKTTDSAQTSTPASTIKIGEVGSLTGSEATFGVSTHEGILLAIEEINRQGGVQGKQLELITIDDQGKPEEAATAITKLITDDHVTAVLGEVASSRSLAMAPIAQMNKIPMVSPSSTNPKVTELGDYIFRVCFIDPFQGSVMARFAAENLKLKKVAILRDLKSDYSVGLANFFTDTFKNLGGSIALDQTFSTGDIDFKSQLTAIRESSPEAIFIPAYYTEVGLIARQARELGLNIPLLGGDGWDSVKLKEIGGSAVDGSYFSNHYSAESESPAVKEFVTKYQNRFGEIPDGLAAMGYEAAQILAYAMKQTKNLTPEEIRDALAAVKEFPGVTDKITIDSHRNALKSAVVLKVEGGQFKYHSSISPEEVLR